MPEKYKQDPELRQERTKSNKSRKLRKRAKEPVRRRIEDWTEEWGNQE